MTPRPVTLELLHLGILGPHHPRRRELVLALQARGRLPSMSSMRWCSTYPPTTASLR